ncbi:MAG: HIT domain-containing protein [Candidatus Pacearchaeota archaeon]
MLNKEQAQQIKKQLFSQIENLDINKEDKEKLKNYILSLDEKGLEEFLIQNNMIKNENFEKKGEEKEIRSINKEIKKDCVFCLIVDNLIPSYKIGENRLSLATLEIKPISKGHVIIIPKKHLNVDKIPISAFSLAKEIAKRIKKRLKPKEISINTSSFSNHGIINIVPFYGNETGKRYEAKKEELEELQKVLTQYKNKEKTKREDKKEDKKLEKEKKSEKEIYKFPRRIP